MMIALFIAHLTISFDTAINGGELWHIAVFHSTGKYGIIGV